MPGAGATALFPGEIRRWWRDAAPSPIPALGPAPVHATAGRIGRRSSWLRENAVRPRNPGRQEKAPSEPPHRRECEPDSTNAASCAKAFAATAPHCPGERDLSHRAYATAIQKSSSAHTACRLRAITRGGSPDLAVFDHAHHAPPAGGGDLSHPTCRPAPATMEFPTLWY